MSRYAHELTQRMGNWFVDSNQTVSPVKEHRLCVDTFFVYSTYALTGILFIWSILTYLVGFGSQTIPYPASQVVVTLGILIYMTYGEISLSSRRAGHVLAYFIGLCWFTIAVLWVGSATYCYIRQGQEFVSENWHHLQTQVLIPYTTQLDSKAAVADNAKVCKKSRTTPFDIANGLMFDPCQSVDSIRLVLSSIFPTLNPLGRSVDCIGRFDSYDAFAHGIGSSSSK